MLALPAAMRLGEPLEVPYPVSPQLLTSLPAIQSVLHEWIPALQMVPVVARASAELPRASQREALFFTGGVDSFYSALQRPDADLVFVLGLDINVRQMALYREVRTQLRGAAEDLGRSFIELETNLRDYLDGYIPWRYAFGIALAAIAQLLAGEYGRLNLSPSFRDPETGDGDPDLIDGGHPRLSALLSTENMAFLAVGGEARRIDKLRALADLPAARQALRVCWENRGQAYNCGACEKCLRTMVGLAALDRLQEFDVFSRPLSYAAVARCVATSSLTQSLLEENLEAARAGADPQLTASLEQANSGPLRGLWAAYNRHTPRRVKNWLYRLSEPLVRKP